jgi:Arc/MetJ-type ribon-helix-helix transcriptional regulator
MKIMPVRLPPEVVEQVDALVGTYGRARFIREAVEAELERRRVHLSAPDVAAVQT